MTEAPSLIYNDAPGTIPASYRFPPGLDARLSSVSATFNGAGASGAFLACLSVYSQDGKLIGRFPTGRTVPAGDSAEVTFAPFLTVDAETPSAGGGLQFGGTGQVYGDHNTGDYLSVTTDQIGDSGFSIDLVSTSVPGIIGFEAGAQLKATNGGKLYLIARGTPTRHPEQQMFVSIENGIEVDADTDFQLFAGNSVYLAVRLNYFLTVPEATTDSDGADVNIILDSFGSGAGTGHKLTVWDQDPDGPGENPIFEVRDDGTIHGRASVGAITWDLPG